MKNLLRYLRIIKIDIGLDLIKPYRKEDVWKS